MGIKRNFEENSFKKFLELCNKKLDKHAQKFGIEKDRNRRQFIGSILVTFCYKEFEKLVLWKFIIQSEVILLFILKQ